MTWMPRPPQANDATIAELSIGHLEQVVAIDSQSDEASDTIPSTAGQRHLGDAIATFFAGLGAQVERDEYANVIATLAGRGRGAQVAPLALMVHIDTSRGTQAVDHLQRLPAWPGNAVPYPANDRLVVDVDTYPDAAEFVGEDLVHGPGEAPFGLDDKLGLAHLMTLARMLVDDADVPHPPLLIIGRPDEEIGRMAAVEGLAGLLAERGVACGYTVDGILPFEVNVENFNASQATLVFPPRSLARTAATTTTTTTTTTTRSVRVALQGVNTHGCTAKAEGFRAATRLAAELIADPQLAAIVLATLVPVRFHSGALRDCDACIDFSVHARDDAEADAAVSALDAALERVVAAHRKRGAGFQLSTFVRGADGDSDSDSEGEGEGEGGTGTNTDDGATLDMLRFVGRFFASAPGFVLAAEESEGQQGYSAPYRAHSTPAGVRLDIRTRDFDADGLAAREAHIRSLADGAADVEISAQYVNMAPRLADHRYLVDWARAAGAAVGVDCRERPIRGGTGVDPFLDHGVPIANLGTGYFAPESEKELTSMQKMVGHAKWLHALVQHVAAVAPKRN